MKLVVNLVVVMRDDDLRPGRLRVQKEPGAVVIIAPDFAVPEPKPRVNPALKVAQGWPMEADVPLNHLKGRSLFRGGA